MSTDTRKSLALIEVTNARQLRIAGCTCNGEPFEVGVSLTRTEGQKLASLLFDLWVPENAWRQPDAKKATFMATYDPDWKAKTIVRLTEEDKRRAEEKGSK